MLHHLALLSLKLVIGTWIMKRYITNLDFKNYSSLPAGMVHSVKLGIDTFFCSNHSDLIPSSNSPSSKSSRCSRCHPIPWWNINKFCHILVSLWPKNPTNRDGGIWKRGFQVGDNWKRQVVLVTEVLSYTNVAAFSTKGKMDRIWSGEWIFT